MDSTVFAQKETIKVAASETRTQIPTESSSRERPPLPFLDHVGFLLNRAAMRIRDNFQEALKPLGISPRHYGVLTLLAHSGPLSQRDISSRTWFGRTSMVNIVDDLEAQELARREACPDDRRAYAVSLTEKGRATQVAAHAIAQRVNEEFLGALTPGERKNLQALLLRLAIETSSPDQSSPADRIRS